jgi:predicted Zn-dependent protease
MAARFGLDAYILSSRAHLKAQSGNTVAALQDYRELCDHHGPSAAHWFNMGFIQETLGQLEAAENSFRQAVALDERLDRAWYGLGLVLIQLSRAEDAIVALKRNTQLQPMSPHGWYQLARIHEQRQEPEEVAKIIRHLQGFEPKVAAQLMSETGINAQANRA